MHRSVLAAGLATAGLLSSLGVAADGGERELAPLEVASDQERPLGQRTELGRLTGHTPLAGSAVDREELETVRFVDSFHELLPRVPGISMSRNLRFTDGGKNYTENRIDGMRARNTGTYTFIDQVNSGDIERIEFIRGPGSVLSGSNAIGGTINVITRDPPRQRLLETTGETFGDGGYRVGVTGGGPLTENVGYFFNANRLDTQGWRRHSEQTKEALSTKWLFRPDSSSKLSLRLEYLHDDYQDPGSLNEAQFNADWRQAQPGSFFRTAVTYLTPSLHYRRLLGTAGELNVYGQSRLTDSTAKTSVTGAISDSDATESNLQLIYRQGFAVAASALTGGLDLLDTDSRSRSYVNRSPDSFTFRRGALSGDSASREQHRSPFLQYEFSPLTPLRFTVGLRHDDLEYRIDDQINNRKDGSRRYRRLVKKGGVVFELDADNLVWANLAEGFMGPGVSTLLGSNTPTPASHEAAVAARYVPTNLALLPEDSLTREIGLRGRLGRLRYDTGYYQTRFRNLIVAQLCADTELCDTRNVNAARAHASGLETSLDYPVTAYLDLGLSHTYARYRYDDYVTAGANYSGKDRYYTPRNHLNLRLAVKPAPGWKLELELDHIDAYYTNQATTDSYKRPDLYNLRASYRDKRWGYWLHLLNLTDVKYAERLGATDAGARNTYSSGYAPLTLRAGVSYQF